MDIFPKKKWKNGQTTGWDIALDGEIGKEKEQRERFIEDFQKLSEKCKTYVGRAPQGFFFNGGDASYGKQMLYPLMEKYSYSVAVMFAQNENRLNYSVNQEYGELKECQNISLRNGYEKIKLFLEQAKVQKVPMVLSDFGEKNQMEISQEEQIEEFTKILDLIQEAYREGDLKVGSIQEYIDYLSEVEEERRRQKKNIKPTNKKMKKREKQFMIHMNKIQGGMLWEKLN